MSTKTTTCARCGNACKCRKSCSCNRSVATAIHAIALVALVAIGSLSLFTTPIVQAANQTWTGQISSSNCGVTHMEGMTARDCTRQCVEGGASYVLVSNNKVYKFANQEDERVRAHAGETVTVTGDLAADVITVSSIEGPAPTGEGR